MEQNNPREIQAALARPFAPEDLEWRLQHTFEDKMRGIAVPYVTNRAIQNRLDEVVGPENWYNSYKPWHGTGKKEAQICGISIYFEGRGFVTKWDGAEDSDIEPVKGGLSDSMKRAAVQWGIGRVLYSMDTVLVDVERKGKSYVIKSSERDALTKAYLDMLKRLGLTPASAGGLQALLAPQNIPDVPPVKRAPQERRNAASTTEGSPTGETAPVKSPDPAPAAPNVPAASQAQQEPSGYEFLVYSSKLQKGMNTHNTLVVLESPDGKRVNAFVRGLHPALQAGVKLTGTRLAVRKQDTVVFYILEDYRIVEPPQQAA